MKDLHFMNLVMSILYFSAGILSVCVCLVTDIFLFLLISICFIFTGIAYLYTYGLEHAEIESKKIKHTSNLDEIITFKRIE